MLRHRANILLIDDNEGDIRLIKEFFKITGAKCAFHVAHNGLSALKWLRTLGKHFFDALPDFILLDINMPKMNGLELLKILKNEPNLKRIPVIVFSSSSADKDVAEAYENGANCFLEKPMGYDEFSKTMKHIWKFWETMVKLPKAR